MQEPLDALRASAGRLQTLVEALSSDELAMPAYPSAWTVADVLSHLGSGAVIFQRRLDDARRGVAMPQEFVQSVWDEWNGKSPAARATDAIAADRALIDCLDAVTPEERAALRIEMGPLSFDLSEYVGLRLNEHTLHTWDVDVALHPDATLAADATAIVIDNLGLVARYTAKPTGHEHAIVVRTSGSARTFTISVAADAVTMTEGGEPEAADLDLPAEAFIRLIYGRLDADHTPPVTNGAEHLDELRSVFPGP